ncbi:MAG: hypothetical protein K2H99_01010 [Paramuribaculum sp.]|nr:hypothetical protein [Paramuribaculum sp.]
MRTKTFREYLECCRFDDIWTAMTENFPEPDELKTVYAEYCEKLKALPPYPADGLIDISGRPTSRPDGMNAAPDMLIDKQVEAYGESPAYVAAVLLYWASPHTFHTSKEHDDDLGRWLDIIEADDCKALGQYMMESIKPQPFATEMRDSIQRKERLFWEETFSHTSSGDWRGILYVLKRKLEYDIGFMRGYADHAGREYDADRMQLCCNLIDGATADIYPDERARRMLGLLFRTLDRNITSWSD